MDFPNTTKRGTAVRAALCAALALLLSIALPPSAASASDDDLTKFETPTIEKDVLEDGEWSDAADAGVGEEVSYRLVGTLPSNWDEYDSYYYCFHDYNDGAIDIDAASVSVALVDADTGESVDVTSAFEISCDDSGLTAECADLKAVDAFAEAEYGDTVVLGYTAVLNASAGSGSSAGNENYAYLVYTSKAFTDALGKSYEDSAALYTWDLQVLKVSSEDGSALEGASFTVFDRASGLYLDGEGGFSAEAVEIACGEGGVLDLAGIDSGSYTLTETTAPDGYEAVAAFTLDIEADLGSDGTVRLSASVDNGSATVSYVQAESGLVQLTVADDESASSAISDLAQTGDPTVVAAGVALAAAVALLAWSLRRRRDDDSRGDGPEEAAE